MLLNTFIWDSNTEGTEGALLTGLGGSSSQAWLKHFLSPWEIFTHDSPICGTDNSRNHRQVLMMTYRLAEVL